MLLNDLDYNKKDEIIKLKAKMKYSISIISANIGYDPFIVSLIFKMHKKNKLHDKKIMKISGKVRKIKSNHIYFIKNLLKE